MNVTDLNVRDSIGWGVVNSAVNADYVLKGISKYVRPDRFYAAFVQSAYNPWCLLDQRRKVKNVHHNFYLKFQDKSIKTGDYMGFTFSRSDLSKIRSHVFREGTVRSLFGEKTDNIFANRISLPSEERYSGKNFGLDKVFEPVIMDESNSFELNQYYVIDNWDGYREMLSSTLRLRIPNVPLIKPKTSLAKIGMYETEEIEYTEEESEQIITINEDYYER